jgi:UDP-N-acetylglucosamine acyltransferase
MSAPEADIHPTATVHPQARLDSGVSIGPYCLVGPGVTLHKNVRLDSHIVLEGRVEVGADCRFSPHSVIGTEPQDIFYKGEETGVEIGPENIFREFVTIHRGTPKGGGLTRIGARNYFMAFAHAGHDCQIGSDVILTHGVTLGGHVHVGDFVNIGGLSGVHQFCRIGRYAFIGGTSTITQDVVPFSRVAGSRPARFFGLNLVGLRRRGFARERLQILKEIFNLLFYSQLNTSQAAERIKAEFPASDDREELLQFIGSSKRGIVKKVSDKWDLESG